MRILNPDMESPSDPMDRSDWGELYAAQDKLVDECKKLAHMFWDHAPSDPEFKEAFSHAKSMAKGYKKALEKETFKTAVEAKRLAGLFINAENLGQVFVNIGTMIKQRAHEIPCIMLGELPLVPQKYEALKKEAMNLAHTLLRDIVEYVVMDTKVESIKPYQELFNCLNAIVSKNGADIESFSATLALLSGLKEGLSGADLEKDLAKAKPFRAMLVKFAHAQLLHLLEDGTRFFKGVKPDFAVYCDAFIAFGNEVEALC